ncbi:mitochondrial 54S ribosomal protein mL67 [Drepanopeziza brunnea f. sp. 'multigermtubi']|uniref:mitochondrial 54S ribosomal protein mL67 n=1 Tax=Drepanopeziza brunnea f. sp. 'multigermtubi' TaxID=698441 RepID=UPI0023A3CBE1|nr:hypothetical protein L3040_004170 [Drepanopeziza brunnea f. sp. 'multigermtubi']
MKPKRMNPEELARRAHQAAEAAASQAAKQAEIAARKANTVPKTPPPEHGREIFVYNHAQRNHVVYSLRKAMNNNAALAQLPFNGKKSVPAALRKDLWHPMARITFPKGSGKVGLSAFQKLREYRKRHELEWETKKGDHIFWDPKAREDKDNPGSFTPGPRTIKARNRLLCDQKANSIADIAAVLNRLASPMQKSTAVPKEGEEGAVTAQEGDTAETGKSAQEGAVEGSQKPEESAEVTKLPNIGLVGEGSGTRVEVLWRDLHDAEFAESWAGNIEHGKLPTPSEDIPTWLKEKTLREKEISDAEEAAARLRNAEEQAAVRARWNALSPEEQAEAKKEALAKKMAARGNAISDADKEAARLRHAEEQAAVRAKWNALSPEEQAEAKKEALAKKMAALENAKHEKKAKKQKVKHVAKRRTTGSTKIRKETV